MIASDAIGQLDHDHLDRPDRLSDVIPVCFMTPSEKMKEQEIIHIQLYNRSQLSEMISLQG